MGGGLGATSLCANKRNCMKSIAQIITNLKDETFLLQNDTESYFEKLRSLFIDITNNRDSNYLFFAFVTLCAATLEYSLNHILITFCIDEFGPRKYKKYADTYIKYPFKLKLSFIPYIVSKGEFIFDEDNSTYKNLCKLIDLRNQLLHRKEYLKEINIFWPTVEELKITKSEIFDINADIRLKKSTIDTITKEDCLMYGESLGDFKKLFIVPFFFHKLSLNEIIKSKT
jgi:hypothetical protein